MINDFRLQNFKSWKDTNNINCSNLTAFFGTNSSGKTSLLQSILLLKQTSEVADRTQVLEFASNYVDLGTFNDVVFNHIIEDNLFFSINFGLDKSHKLKDPNGSTKDILFEDKVLKFTCEIGLTEGSKKLISKKFNYNFDNAAFELNRKDDGKYQLNSHNSNFSFKRIQGRAYDLPQPIKFYGFPDQVRSYYQNAGFLSDFQFLIEEQFSKIYYLGPLRDYPQREYTWAGSQPMDMGARGENVVDAILASSDRAKISRGTGKSKFTLEEYVAYWLKKLGLIYDFRVDRIVDDSNLYRVKVKKTRNSSEVLITDVGFGVSQILPVITLCYYVPKGSTLIIEQPEIHLHPKIQAGLADVFIDAIKVRKIQIILESHSEHLLKRLQRRIAEDEFTKNEISLFFCDNKKGQSTIEPLKVNSFGQIENWPKDFFGNQTEEMIKTQSMIVKRKKETLLKKN